MTRTGVRDKTPGGPSEGCPKNQGRGVCREEPAEERGLGCIGWDFNPFVRGFPFDMRWKSRVSEKEPQNPLERIITKSKHIHVLYLRDLEYLPSEDEFSLVLK